MRRTFRPPFSRDARGDRGFTLLELTVAMTFMAVLATGIALSISTCLNVWQRSVEAADLNQEARAIVELLSRDIRGAYLGLKRDAGYLVGEPAQADAAPVDRIAVCTGSSSLSRAALVPEELWAEWSPETHTPVTDYVEVRYELLEPGGGARTGLYRTTRLVPVGLEALAGRGGYGEMSPELISSAVVALALSYFDGGAWVREWTVTEGRSGLPRAVSVDLTLRDARGRKHVYQTIVPVAIQ